MGYNEVEIQTNLIDLFICTVNFNNASGLKRTISSYDLINNTKFRIHPIIVDAWSTDGSVEIVRNSGFKYIIEKDKGIYDGMNKGIIHFSKSEFQKYPNKHLIFMNSGDEFHADINKLNPEDLGKNDLNIFRNYRDDGNVDERFDIILLKHGFMPICHQAVLYNLTRLSPQEILYSLSTFSYNDYRQLYKLIIKNNKSYKFHEESIAVYEQETTTGLSRSDNKFRLEKYKIIFNLSGIPGVFRALHFRIFSKYYKSKYRK